MLSNSLMVALLIVLLVLLISVTTLAAGLIILRQRRRTRQAARISSWTEKRTSTSSVQSRHRRTKAMPSQSIQILNEKQWFEDWPERPMSPGELPEIRITFPEEVDSAGKRQSGRVVVVHVGNTGVGLEGCDEDIPSYQQFGGARFESIDLEKVGGLQERLGWR